MTIYEIGISIPAIVQPGVSEYLTLIKVGGSPGEEPGIGPCDVRGSNLNVMIIQEGLGVCSRRERDPGRAADNAFPLFLVRDCPDVMFVPRESLCENAAGQQPSDPS